MLHACGPSRSNTSNGASGLPAPLPRSQHVQKDVVKAQVKPVTADLLAQLGQGLAGHGHKERGFAAGHKIDGREAGLVLEPRATQVRVQVALENLAQRANVDWAACCNQRLYVSVSVSVKSNDGKVSCANQKKSHTVTHQTCSFPSEQG